MARIDLAPGHKQGLVVDNPVLLAGGVMGYGEVVPKGLDLARAGAVVVGPLMGQSRSGAPPPRVAETAGGLVLETGLQNRGLKSTLTKFSRLWPRLGCPVVAQVAEGDPRSLADVIDRLQAVDGLSGLELLPLTTDLDLCRRLVRTASRHSDLPVWVLLPLDEAAAWASAVVDAGASAVVVAQPVRGLLPHHKPSSSPSGPTVVRGNVYGPLSFALALEQLVAVAELRLPCALIARGGIHTAAQARQALAAGARAVQLDSALWVEPALLGWLVDDLAAGSATGAPTAGREHSR